MSDYPKIEILQQNTDIEMTDMQYPTPEDNQKVLYAQGDFGASGSVRLLIRADATEQLFQSIGWGVKPKPKDVEKAGLLVGKYRKDSSHGQSVVWGDVETVIPFDPALVQATKTTIIITQDAWRKMLDEYVPYNNQGLLMLGWYHTHLDDMPPRFSALDIANQRQHFSGKYSFAVVLNPNQKKWAVFWGSSAKECRGESFVTNETLVRYNEPRITIQNVSGNSELLPNGTVVHRNPDGSIVRPLQPVLVLEETRTLSQAFGQFLERVGRQLNRPKYPTSGHQPPMMQPNVTIDNAPKPQIPVPQQHISEQSDQVRRPNESKIAIKETAKPKITILPKGEYDQTKFTVKSQLFVVSPDEIYHPVLQRGDEDLQVDDQNIISIVESILRNFDITAPYIDSPINAHIDVTADLTIKIRLCEEKDNTIIRISRQPLANAFSDDHIRIQVESFAKLVKEIADISCYILYVSILPECIEVIAFQINRRA